MSTQPSKPQASRREILRLGGAAAMGIATVGTELIAPTPLNAQQVTYPNKVWNISGQDAFILADEATQTYYRTTTGGPQVRLSKNLVDWSNAFNIWTNPPAAQRWFATTAPWACEMHFHNGKYYLFQTRHNSGLVFAQSQLATTPDPYSIWHSQWGRATMIAVSDSPMGPFVGLDNSRPTHDPRFMTLDGTFIVDEEGPWMVYCHEWIQKINGGVAAVPLTPDLSAASGDSILLFRGTDASWRSRAKGSVAPGTPVINPVQSATKVTDGCQFCWTPSGYLLMIWTNPGGIYSYNELQAISKSGKVRGPWEQVYREPFIHGDRGHGNIFKTFEGQDMLVTMNRTATGGLGSGVRSEYYEIEITDDGIKVLNHRNDLDGQPGMPLADTEAPDLHLPPNLVVNASSSKGAAVGYTAFAHDWRQGPVPLVTSHNTGTRFPVGDTQVACQAQDDAQNVASAAFNVHVKGAAEQVADLIELISLGPPAAGASLTSHLNNALGLLTAGNNRAAGTVLKTFITSVQGLSGTPALSISLANKLIAGATRIIFVSAEEVTSQVRLTSSGLLYNRATGVFSGTFTVQNTDTSPIVGPLHIVLMDAPASVTFVNPSSVAADGPVFTINTPILGPSQSVTAPYQLRNSSSAVPSWQALVYAGDF